MTTPSLEQAQAALIAANTAADEARARLVDIEAKIAAGVGISGADYQAVLGDVSVAEGAIAGAQASLAQAQANAQAEASAAFASEVVAWHESAVPELQACHAAAAAAVLAFAGAAKAHNDQIVTYASRSRAFGRPTGIIDTHPLRPREPTYLGRRVELVTVGELLASLVAEGDAAADAAIPAGLAVPLRNFAQGAQPIGK